MHSYTKVLVAGGNGFVGKNVCQVLQERNIPYVSVDITDGFDFRNFTETKLFFEKEKFDAVINCAAFVGGVAFAKDHAGEMYYNNIILSANLMECARLTGVKRFINPIPNCSYPGHLDTYSEADWWNGQLHESVLSYGFARKASWVQGWSYQKQYGFDSIHLVLPNMYGPEDHFEEVRSHALGALVMKFVTAKESNSPTVTVWGTGKPIREWLYVKDGAQAIVRALDIDSTIEPINIGKGESISVIDLAETIKKAVGYSGEIVLDTTKPDGAMVKIMNAEKMKSIFNWEPKTSLTDGIKETVNWYIHNKK